MQHIPTNSAITRIAVRLKELFTAHPESVGEGYFEHQRAAFRFAFILSSAAMMACVHALIPGFCQSSARRRVAQLYEELQSRSGQSAG